MQEPKKEVTEKRKVLAAVWEGKYWSGHTTLPPDWSPDDRVTYVQASVQFLFSDESFLTRRLEPIGSPIDSVPVKDLFSTSTCSPFFPPLPHIVTVMWFVSSLWISTVPCFCTHCPGGVRAQREDNGGIWTLILLLTLPIILCHCCTCSPITLPLLLCHPSSPLTLLLLVFFAPNYVLFRSLKTTDLILPSSLSYFFSGLLLLLFFF